MKEPDHYNERAHAEGYVSRAAYKLQQMQPKFKLMRRGDVVIDLGAAPGGWSQIASKIVGSRGRVIAVDIQPLAVSGKNIFYVHGDITQSETVSLIIEKAGAADVVVCDAAPNTSGIVRIDQARSADLVRAAHKIAVRLLKRGGNFVTKIFQGPESEKVIRELRADFKSVKVSKPEASRKESKEIYIICKCLKA